MDIDMLDVVTTFDHVLEYRIAGFLTAKIVVQADKTDGMKITNHECTILVCPHTIPILSIGKRSAIVQCNLHIIPPYDGIIAQSAVNVKAFMMPVTIIIFFYLIVGTLSGGP